MRSDHLYRTVGGLLRPHGALFHARRPTISPWRRRASVGLLQSTAPHASGTGHDCSSHFARRPQHPLGRRLTLILGRLRFCCLLQGLFPIEAGSFVSLKKSLKNQYPIPHITFQIFVLVVFFGLYNGLVVLPILLSFCGPSFKPSEGEQSSSRKACEEDGSRQASSISPTNEQDAVCDDELKQLSPKKPAGIRVTTC